jgi:hypothetical protein
VNERVRRRVRCTLLLTAGFGTLVSSVASALPTSEFRYLRDEGAAQCPSESELRAAVSARLGYDPFQKGAARTIRASIETMTEGFRARVELEGGHEGHGQREIVTKGSCLELVSAIALSISLAIDAERASATGGASTTDGIFAAASETPSAQGAAAQPAPPKATAVEVPKPVPTPETKPEPAVARRSRVEPTQEWADDPAPRRPRGPHIPLPLDFALGTHLELLSGSAPSTAIGGSLFVQARRDWLSLELGLRADAPAGQTIANEARVRTGVVAFQLVPCAHFHVMKVCAVGQVGEIWATSEELPRNRTDLAVYSAAGLRLGVEWPRNAAWALSAHADAMALLTRVQVTVDSQSVWEAPGSFGSLGAGGLIRF